MSHTRDEILIEAIRTAGGLAKLGGALGITAQGVWRWRRIPAHHVLGVEKATGISRERLRPDLYGAPRPRPRKKVVAEAVA